MTEFRLSNGAYRLRRVVARAAVAVGLAMCLAATSACSDSSGNGGGEGSGAAGQQGGQQAPVQVGVVTIEPQPVSITAAVAGRVVAFQTAQVRPQVGGLITERLFEEGADVEKGEILYKLDDRSYQAQVASAEATLQKNQAALASAQLQYERYQDLTDSNVISQSDRDAALSTFRQAEADVAVAEAALETAKLNLDYTSIEAPISGRIGTDPADAGNLVTADQTEALATIRQIDPVYVDLTESSGNLMKFRDQIRQGGVRALVGPENPGKAVVRIRFADGSTYPQTGTIDAADQFVSETTSSFTVRTQFPNPEDTLLPGMYVRGTIQLAIDESGFLLPQRGVSRNARGEPTAMFVTDDGTVEERVLEVSTDIGNDWWVTKGVSAGDRLVVDGLQKVRAGARVTPVAVTIDDQGLVQAVDASDAPATTTGGKGEGTPGGGSAAADDTAPAASAAGTAEAEGAQAESPASVGDASATEPGAGDASAESRGPKSSSGTKSSGADGGAANGAGE
ncbi:efflux RND transporter periplasmic adaptor subunit [Aurantimonas sp. 22II-16-19i]|uniref:efflux RND transporter periplasmic adaptor subunit n=1 Tax=Aurantimonas sp. 22II-16-19i TaxID=1317114 RepID=UPI0009F7B05D|nr:efflux RND transporter periplasmic adaptor subunit [Aurantimonas sp. 22II-16-19i]ORE86714.1 resistance nodulation cell division (RND) drug efflux pump, MFP component [Aurantimonas sp. 22II-16-19i]